MIVINNELQGLFGMTFKNGESGNKDGRPKGTGHRQQLFNSLVEPHREELFACAIKLALSGNENMLRLFLERMLPIKPKDDAISLDISGQDLSKCNSLLQVGKSVLEGVANSELTPEQARVVMNSIDSQCKQIESHELELRLNAIENALQIRK